MNTIDISWTQEQLQIHLNNRRQYLRQIEFHGTIALCPPMTINGYNEAIRNIVEYKRRLREAGLDYPYRAGEEIEI